MTVITVYIFVEKIWWFPPTITDEGAQFDAQFFRTLMLTGVIFIAATQDKYFRAVDEMTGRVLWETRLPAGGQAAPMTYLGRDGRQYVLIAAGGSPSFGTGSADSFIAYRLKS